ncbi:SymE family type I addiction module toxin [bacterium SCSIO 12643]|nr:SymE family type I addiction module toxin [bacterium SCSIO 12643]
MNRFRQLKIQRRFRYKGSYTTTVPEIRLEGRWLEKLGFNEGDQIQIEQQPQKLTITLLKESQ